MDISNASTYRLEANNKLASDVERTKISPADNLKNDEPKEAKEQQEPDLKTVESAVEGLNQYAQSIRRDLAFSLQGEPGQVVVEVTDSETGELIRKIPSEEALKLSERIAEVRSLMTSVEV
jgi:flagellar protein FlaG